jgi:hypothetical protein
VVINVAKAIKQGKNAAILTFVEVKKKSGLDQFLIA